MKDQITITISAEQYNTIKDTLARNAAQAFVDGDQAAFEMYQSAYQAIIAVENKGDAK